MVVSFSHRRKKASLNLGPFREKKNTKEKVHVHQQVRDLRTKVSEGRKTDENSLSKVSNGASTINAQSMQRYVSSSENTFSETESPFSPCKYYHAQSMRKHVSPSRNSFQRQSISILKMLVPSDMAYPKMPSPLRSLDSEAMLVPLLCSALLNPSILPSFFLLSNHSFQPTFLPSFSQPPVIQKKRKQRKISYLNHHHHHLLPPLLLLPPPPCPPCPPPPAPLSRPNPPKSTPPSTTTSPSSNVYLRS